MEILTLPLIVATIAAIYLWLGYRLKLPIESHQTPHISTLATVLVSSNGKKDYHETSRVSVYSDSIVVMRLPRLSRYSFEVRDYTTGLASLRSNFSFIRAIFNETKYRFAHRITPAAITSLKIDKSRGVATIIYKDDDNVSYALHISKLLNLSQTHLKLIDSLSHFA